MHVRLRDGRVEDVQPAHLRAAALLRGVPARPALHRGARHHRAHLRDLPGRLPDELDARRWRTPAASSVPDAVRALRRLLYCGEWIESHALHVFMLHAPGLPGLRERLRRWRATTASSSSGRCALKKAGNALMRVVGGREIHPINVRVGGFYRAPTRAELAPRGRASCERAREFAREAVAWAAALPFPDVEEDFVFVALRDARRYAIEGGPAGLEHRPGRRSRRVRRARRRGAGAALDRAALPPARRDALPRRPAGPLRAQRRPAGAGRARGGRRGRPRARRAATRSAASSCAASRCSTRSTRRCALVDAYVPPDPPAVDVPPRAGVGFGWTEAPRGLLWHRYELDDDGTVLDARIVPPTSQNQGRIEQSVRHCVELHADLPDADLQAELRAGGAQLRPVHLLRDALPAPGDRPRVSSSSAWATAGAATTPRASRSPGACANWPEVEGASTRATRRAGRGVVGRSRQRHRARCRRPICGAVSRRSPWRPSHRR